MIARAQKLIMGFARKFRFAGEPRTLGVRALVIDPDGRAVLVRHRYLDDYWYLPGGGVERDESIIDALGRELKEEVDIGAFTIERLLGAYHNRRERKDDHVIVYVVRVDADSARAMRPADPLEIAEAHWFAFDALPAQASPATLRRIAEYRNGAIGCGGW